ncbi:MAG: SDR family oxidoreductase [Ignavibacteria bacterium]|nr:SDR family oxidoreductase [Ignavibacteria bacterium]
MSSVLITGASGNLGQAVQKELSERGWNAIPISTDDGDLTNPDDVDRIAGSFPADLSAAALLVGGIRAGVLIEEILLQDFQFMLNLNVITTFNVMKAIIPVLKKNNGGSIVTMGAQIVMHPAANKAAYSAAKTAVVALTQSAAEEGRPFGIRANSILPSILKTKENIDWAGEEEARKWPTPEEVASIIAFLISPQCTLTGAIIPMFGELNF